MGYKELPEKISKMIISIKRTIRNTSTNHLKFQRYAGLVSVISIVILILSILGVFNINWYLAFFMYFMYWCVGVSIYYHRYISHRSFEFRNKFFKYFCLFFGVIAGQGDPLRWAAVHRHHHLHSDTEDDPHGPHKGWISYFLSDAYGDINLILKDRRVKSKLNLFLFKYYFLCLIAWWLLLFILGGWWLVLNISILPIGMYLTGVNATVQLTHKYGYKNFHVKDEARNNWWVNLFSFGEGWHNNHHAKPRKYTFQEKWWEFDLGGFIIKRFLKAP